MSSTNTQAAPAPPRAGGGADTTGSAVEPTAAATAAPVPPAAPAKPVPPYLFPLNFFALGLVLTGVLAWFAFYTHWFEGLVTLLGLGGLLGGVATLFKAVSKDRVEAAQGWFTRVFFDHHCTWVGALAAGGIFLLAVSCVGTIQVDHQAGSPWLVQTARAGDPLAAADAEQITAGGRLREWYCMYPWRTTQVRVKVAGLPAQTETIGPWSRKRVACPASFLRPVVLIGANRMALESEKKKLRLVVTVDGVEWTQDPYQKRVVILGSDEADIPYPASLAASDAWKDVLTDVRLAENVRPAAAVRVAWTLLPNKVVTAKLLDDKTVYCENSLVVAEPADVAGMVQDMMLVRK
jgi:hypothetical protein